VGKSKSHYVLAEIQTQMKTVPDMNLTVSARSGIRDVGMAQVDALDVVQALTRQNFYKSMTTHVSHQVWQDVYHGDWNGSRLYV
jgi:motility quorum-sensing regulator/GCU-specific mRNA interferase toxin